MPSEISGGMARRVALARAIALDPALIMYDEPFAGLDPISLGVTANLIRKLNDALHSTSVIVTHDVVETFEIADYVYMINAGRVAAEGSPEELCLSLIHISSTRVPCARSWAASTSQDLCGAASDRRSGLHSSSAPRACCP